MQTLQIKLLEQPKKYAWSAIKKLNLLIRLTCQENITVFVLIFVFNVCYDKNTNFLFTELRITLIRSVAYMYTWHIFYKHETSLFDPGGGRWNALKL